MKALFFNGSPRKNWTTVRMLEQAMEGAKAAGAEVELIHLHDYDFKGCISCFACKRKNARTDGVCAVRDELQPILEAAHEADVIVLGTPVYFSYPTGVLRSFMERLLFPINSYNPKIDPETGEMKSSLLDKFVPTAMIYTMGCPPEMAEVNHYSEIFGENARFLENLFGYTETLCSYHAYQFKSYEPYDVMEGTEQVRAKYRDEQLPKDLQKAYELGARLVEMRKRTAMPAV